MDSPTAIPPDAPANDPGSASDAPVDDPAAGPGAADAEPGADAVSAASAHGRPVVSRSARRVAGRPSLLPPDWLVHVPVFEGPLDLLLHLVKINEVEITDIPVATVCDQFHEYLALAEEVDLDIAGEYIYEAALLIHLKSKLLLPRQKDETGKPIEEDPREDLVERLLEYRRIREAAQSLAEVDRLRSGVWPRPAVTVDLGKPGPDEEIDLGEVSLFDLLRSLRSVLDRYDREHPPPVRFRPDTFSVREQIDRLLGAMGRSGAFDFLEDLRHLSCRAEAVSAFLAVLELARMGLVSLHQTGAGDILLYRTTREVDERALEAIGS